jgi:hypothetical protein
MLRAIGVIVVAIIIAMGVVKALELIRSKVSDKSEGDKN